MSINNIITLICIMFLVCHSQVLTRERFEEFRSDVIDLIDCKFNPNCPGLTIQHPDVTIYDMVGNPSTAIRVMIGGLVRLSFHDCAGINVNKVKSGNNKFFIDADKNGNAGGCNGCIDLGNSDHNNLLDSAILPLQPICDDYSNDGMSRADCWALAATISNEFAANELEIQRDLGIIVEPSVIEGDIPYYYGRTDCNNNGYLETEYSNPEGVTFPFPDAMQGWKHVTEFLRSRFGWNNDPDYFTIRDTIALISGGHSIGTAHEKISGFTGSWDFGPDALDNQFASLLFGEDMSYFPFNQIQNLNQSIEHPEINGSKPQWSMLQNENVHRAFPVLRLLNPPILKMIMMFNTDFSMVYDISFYIENGLETQIDCNSNAQAICKDGQTIITAQRGLTSLYNYGKNGEDLGEQYECVDGEDCCEYIQCPIQCEGGWKEFRRLVDNDLLDDLDDDTDCPAAVVKSYSMNMEFDITKSNRKMGKEYAEAFTKMITIGYVDKKSGEVYLNTVADAEAAVVSTNEYSSVNNGVHVSILAISCIVSVIAISIAVFFYVKARRIKRQMENEKNIAMDLFKGKETEIRNSEIVVADVEVITNKDQV